MIPAVVDTLLEGLAFSVLLGIAFVFGYWAMELLFGEDDDGPA